MTGPLVSILIPAFNAEQWIAATIRSALAQTWEEKEIIIVDDGSRDRTLAIARRYEGDRVRVTTQKNEGAAATRNRAFSLSRGAMIQWLDADDLLSANKIERQMQARLTDSLATAKTLFSCAWGRFFYRESRSEFQPSPLWRDLSPSEWLIRKMSRNAHMQTATWLVSRELTEAAGLWNTSLLSDDDGEYFCRVLMKSDGVRFVPDAKVFYRTSGAASLSYIGVSSRKIEALWQSMRLHIKYLRMLDDGQVARAACLQYLQTWLPNFYPERLDLVAEMEEAAKALGGTLTPPRLPWKYAWIRPILGQKVTRHAQLSLPKLRWSVIRSLDKMASHAETIRRVAKQGQ